MLTIIQELVCAFKAFVGLGGVCKEGEDENMVGGDDQARQVVLPLITKAAGQPCVQQVVAFLLQLGEHVDVVVVTPAATTAQR